MEPPQPVDPTTDQTSSIPQARRSAEENPVPVPRDSDPTPMAPPPRTGARAQSPGDQDLPDDAAGMDDAGSEPAPLPGVWNARTILVVVLAVVMVLVAAGAITGYALYHRATEPDRSTPGVAVRQYVETAFNDRDAQRSAQFTCGDPNGVAAGQALLRQIAEIEQAHQVKVMVSVEDINAQAEGNHATVTGRVRLAVAVGGATQEQLQQWSFTLARQAGWRVCAAERTG